MSAALPARYTVIKPLDGGGMSDTRLCFCSHLKRHVVFKSLKPGTSQKRILDELSALSAIRSDHVVQVLDVIRDSSGIIGFIEEYIDGSDLEWSEIDSVSTALKVLHSIASGVRDVHEQGRLHRDLKPDNMKIDNNGTLKIFDFGLAKEAGGSGTKNFYYSPGFTSPEAFKKNAFGLHEYSEAVDVYAFGAIALWLLNEGILPDSMKALPATAPNPAVDFQATRVPCPATVAGQLSLCLSASPAARPSIAEMCLVLEREILKGTHRLTLTTDTQIYVLDATRVSVPINFEGSRIEILYDGYEFTVASVTGGVEINNMRVSAGFVLSGSVVIVLSGNNKRAFVTADASHPEVSH